MTQLETTIAFLSDRAQDTRYKFLPSIQIVPANIDAAVYEQSLSSRMFAPIATYEPEAILKDEGLVLVSSLPKHIAGTYAFSYEMPDGSFGVYVGIGACLVTREGCNTAKYAYNARGIRRT